MNYLCLFILLKQQGRAYYDLNFFFLNFQKTVKTTVSYYDFI